MKQEIVKIVRFQTERSIGWAILKQDRLFSLEGNLYDRFQKGRELCPLQEAKLLAPVEPKIMVCVGMNYQERFEEKDYKDSGWTRPEEPIVFFKPPTAVVGPTDDVVFPSMAQTLRYEAELCVVMKRSARNVSEREAADYILGYTCGNELGAIDLVKKDRWLTRAKGFDTSGPLGPALAVNLDPHQLAIRSWVNREKKQDGNTRDMIFPVEKLVSFITAFMTLQPGDVIWSGTPEGCDYVKIGDVMEVEIEGIGTIKNKVVPG